MKKHLNTLFITQQDTWVAKDGETVAIKQHGKTLFRIPIHLIEGIVCFGNVLVSPYLMAHCAKNNVTISFLNPNGRFLARVSGPIAGNVLLRRTQYKWADDPLKRLNLARAFVFGKVANCKAVLLRAQRDYPELKNVLHEPIEKLSSALHHLYQVKTLDDVRGIEGQCASLYFSFFNHLIRRKDRVFTFYRRSRRPPKDRVNALLSFVYTLLVHDVISALETIGLDPQVGYLHTDRPGRPSLALDLMEELRPLFADRFVLRLINRKQIQKRDFRVSESTAVLLNEEGRKKVLVAYQDRKKEKITHPFTGESCTYGAVPFIQAMLLARFLRGDLDGYPPYLWK